MSDSDDYWSEAMVGMVVIPGSILTDAEVTQKALQDKKDRLKKRRLIVKKREQRNKQKAEREAHARN